MKKFYPVILLSCLMILLFVSCKINSPDWVQYKVYKDGTHYYKKVKIEKNEGKYIIQYWNKNIFSDEYKKEIIQILGKHGKSIKGWNELSHDMDLFEMDCKKNKYRILSSALYNTYGDELYSTSEEKPKWNNITPSSEMELFQKTICK
jgi:hypothetical protein